MFEIRAKIPNTHALEKINCIWKSIILKRMHADFSEPDEPLLFDHWNKRFYITDLIYSYSDEFCGFYCSHPRLNRVGILGSSIHCYCFKCDYDTRNTSTLWFHSSHVTPTSVCVVYCFDLWNQWYRSTQVHNSEPKASRTMSYLLLWEI